ncbi:MAG: uracil-DNA glycosylase [Methylococcales bacterium]|nr:uracil-DNA glycosylase [Methylococcales bacterium]
MNETLRLHYLEAMGIESWYSKNASKIETPTENRTPCHQVAPMQPPLAKPEPLAQPILTINDNWSQLEQDVRSCQKCELYPTRKQTVFGTGNITADWLFIGEAPNETEDLQGIPFVDNAGLLFTEMMRAMNLTRDEIFMTNILKCRPPNSRDPHVNELNQCHDYLKRQHALIKPKIIVAVGRVAAQKLLKTHEPLSKLRGVVHTFDQTPLIVVYHPAYLLRSLSQKRAAWQDLQLALKTYQQLPH